MTKELQTSISPYDIQGIRLQCKCGTRVSIPVSGDSRERLHNLRKCPSCGFPWFFSASDQRLRTLMSYMAAILDMQLMAAESRDPDAMKLSLELSSEASDRAASDKD